MAIFIDESSRILVQGMTGREGRKHTQRMIMSGTRIAGGVTPGKGGQSVLFEEDPVPVFSSVAEGMDATGANVSVVFVPPRFARDAVLEAVEAEIELCVVITEGIPVRDALEVHAAAASSRTRIIGPNCPGLISPGKSNVGIIPAHIAGRGGIGLVSKSGTLTYQMMYELRDHGFSTAVGIGGDPVIGTSHIDVLQAFEEDDDTDVIVMIGEIGGDAEERAGEYIAQNITKPVIGYVAGFTAPPGKTMGHAGAIITGSGGTAAAKKKALESAGVMVGETPSQTASLARDAIADIRRQSA